MPNFTKSTKKYRKHGSKFIYALKYSMSVAVSVFTKLMFLDKFSWIT